MKALRNFLIVLVLSINVSLTFAGENFFNLDLNYKPYEPQSAYKSKDFQGDLFIPKAITVKKGLGGFKGTRAFVIFDDDVVCKYFNNGIFHLKELKFESCNNGANVNDIIEVGDNVAIRIVKNGIFYKIHLKVRMKINDDEPTEGIIFEGINPEAGQILKFDGEYWVPVDGSGLQGPQGEQGIQGLQGPQGIAGEKGENGDDGIEGPQGLQGIAGEKGDAGIQGIQGIVGEKGDAGIQGPQGLQGIVGEKGDAGIQGIAGEKGDTGIQGIAGEKGDAGIQGIVGEKGDAGIQGLQGIVGEKGDAGIQGIAGEKGDAGIQGLQGIAGEKGDNGIQGLQGIAGEKGDNGIQGEQGIQGIQGEQGAQGFPGLPGMVGEKGEKGDAGDPATVSLTAGIGVLGTTITSTGTINIDVGVGANQIPQLDGEGKLAASVIPEGAGGVDYKVAYLKDVKPSGVHAGSTVTGTWYIRELNTLSGDTSFVSLNANEFTLISGTYRIEAYSPGTLVQTHQAKLYDVTHAADSLLGSSERSHPTYGSTTTSRIFGDLVVTEDTTYHVRHKFGFNRPTLGLGMATGFTSNEIYLQIKIIKVK